MNIGEYGLQINNIMNNKPILKESGRKVEACIDYLMWGHLSLVALLNTIYIDILLRILQKF